MIDKLIKVSIGIMAAAFAVLVMLFVTYFSVALIIGISRLLTSY